MGGFFGPVGGLVHVPFTSSEPEEVGSRSTYTQALSGRVTEQRGPRPRRKWDCSIEISRPDDHHMLDQIAAGLFGPGPHVWYSAMARVTNILTPWESMFAENTWSRGAHGGAGATSDGTPYVRSRTSDPSTTMALARDVAVPTQFPLAVSAYISTHPSTAATLYVDEVDPEGAVVATHQASVAADRWAVRAVVLFTSSVRTVAVRLRVSGALMMTLPAVSLTHRPMGWSAGRGCIAASINLGGSDPRFAFESKDGWGRRESRSFTIHELG